MFRSKTKADQQATLILSKVQDDNERRLRGYQLGNLYYQAKDYDQARKYVSQFLSVKEGYAPGHKLMGQILERSVDAEDIKKAITCYRRSYELDDSQKQILLKICALYLRVDITPDQTSTVQYWIDKAKVMYPNDPTIFNLQEKMLQQSLRLTADPGGSQLADETAMEELLISNLRSRPHDINVRLKLLKNYERSQQFELALPYVGEVIWSTPYMNNFEWCNYTSQMLKFVTKNMNEGTGWAYYLVQNFGAARTAIRNGSEKAAVDTLRRLDHALFATKTFTDPLICATRDELKAHQLLLAANLMVRRNADPAMISALYVAAYNMNVAKPSDLALGSGDDGRRVCEGIERLRADRLTQSGFVVMDRAPSADQLTWLRKLSKKFFTKDGKGALYSAIFGAGGDDKSMLLSEPSIEAIQATLPSEHDLYELCTTSQSLYADSLHHQTWLTLRLPGNVIANYALELVANVSFSPARLTTSEPDSLSQMDLAVFLYHVAYSARSRLREHPVGGSNHLKVADMTASLCSDEQAQWWRAAYQASGHHSPSAGVLHFGKHRQVLSRGLQVIRIVDTYRLPIQMVCHMAHLLQAKLEEVKAESSGANSKASHLRNWAKRYRSEASQMLTKLDNCGTLSGPREKLFICHDEDWRPGQVKEELAKGELWLAQQLYEEGQEDEALSEFLKLPQAQASYMAAKIQLSRADANVHSKDVQVMYLTRAQESLYLTSDRLATDYTNPLNSEVERDLERVESELNGCSADHLNDEVTHGVDGVLPNSAHGNGSFLSTPKSERNASNGKISFPSRTPAMSLAELTSSPRVRPSPERLELQLRTLTSKQDALQNSILEERDLVRQMEALDTKLGQMADELKKELQSQRQTMAEIKELVSAKPPVSQPAPPAAPQPTASDAQLALMQQQIVALTAMVTTMQNPLLRPPPTASALSGHGTPSRGTPPVFNQIAGDGMLLGTYPHIHQPQSTTPSRAQSASEAALTQQEMQAAALAAAEQGYDGREYYVDDGENYYGDDYPEADLYGDGNTSYVGAEGGNTIAYMPKTSSTGKPMPQPGFFAQPDKSQAKLAEPKPSEQGVPPNVVMNKEMMKTEADNNSAETEQTPLVVNVPKPGSLPIVPTTPTSTCQSKVVPASPAKSDSGSHHDSSFDPHFEPIIELPPEIDVVTGEEDEEILFEGRAKLFRKADKEWKERGVGPVKVLEQKKTAGKCRILMRRDQVHKICLNHAVQAEMKLLAHGDKGVAWIWVATDYSEAEPTKETFAIRFKTPEIAADFKKAYDLATEKSSSAASGDSKTTDTTPVAVSSASTPEGDKASSEAEKPAAKPADQKPVTAGFGSFQFSKPATPADKSSPEKTPSLFGNLGKSTSGLNASGGSSLFESKPATAGLSTGSLFGTKPNGGTSFGATFNAFTKPTQATPSGGLFGTPPVSSSTNKPTTTSAGAVNSEANQDSSLLRQLLTAEPSKPEQKFSSGGFSFTAPPKISETTADKPTETKPAADSGSSLFAGFGGFGTPKPAGGFTFSPAADSASTPFSFASAAKSSLLPAKSAELRPSSSAPELNKSPKPVTPKTSKDDLEAECSAEFEPVIELPDLVEVTTGEEDEEKLFGERCKLFRMSDGQWKERGVGELKLLRNPTTHVCRLVMRRDQVLKICANHRITANMILAPNGEKAKIWAAQDFAEGEVKSETFCARFKTAEIAASFEKTFQEAAAASDSSSVDKKKDDKPSNAESTKSQPSLADMFKAKSGEWRCDGCGVQNKADVNNCPCCAAAKPGADTTTSTSQPTKPVQPVGGGFGSFSLTSSVTAAEPASATKPTQPVGGGFGSFSLSSFGTPAKPASPAKPVQPAGGGFGSFSLTTSGTPAKPASPVKPAQESKQQSPTKASNVSGELYVEDDGEGDNIYFEPVIELPDIVDVKTGEEEETELFVHRAKLYRFANREMKERGLGDVKLLKHKVTGKTRIILRREKVLKLACNHMITANMELKPMDKGEGKVWLWHAVDFSEGPGKEEVFAIRFKTAEVAQQFYDVFDAARKDQPTVVDSNAASTQASSESPAGDKPLFGDIKVCSPSTPGSKPDPKSVFGNAAKTDSTGSIFGNAPGASSNLFGGATPAQSTSTPNTTSKSKIPVAAKQGATTPSQLFGGASKEQTTLSVKSLIPVSSGQSLLAQPKLAQPQSLFGAAALSTSNSSNKSSSSNQGSLFGARPTPQSLFGGAGAKGASVFGGSSAISQPASGGDVVFVSESKPSEELVKKAQEFLLPAGFFLYETRKDCRGCIGCPANEDAIIDHLFHQKPYKPLPGMSVASRQTNKPAAVETATSVFAPFSSASNDFSSLSASSSSSNAFRKTEGFKWSGAGKTLFGGQSGQNKQDDENPEAFEAEADFKPVLEVLPELIDIKTGEEDEEKTFCNRAKLFRFDTASQQWKERGVGDLKLLKHAQNGTIRILLRREQVHKLVCNHLIQPSMELKPLATSETAWCWTAQDYSDTSVEDVQIEQFAVRFKNIELAKEFKRSFEESKEFVRQARESKAAQSASTEGAATESMSSGSVPTESASSESVPTESASSTTAATNPSSSDDSGSTVVEEGYEEDDDSDDGSDVKLMFEKQITLLEKRGGSFESLGVRMLQVVEENMDLVGGIAIHIYNGDRLEHRQLIFMETPPATLDKASCSWRMYDFMGHRPLHKEFQAKFASAAAADEFSHYVEQGIAYAREMKLHERDALQSSMATNPTEICMPVAQASLD